MNMLAIFTNFSSGQIVAIILLTVFILTVWLVKFFCLSRINIIDLSITIVLFLLCLFVDLNEILIIICIIVNSLDLVYALLDLALYVYMKNEISQKTIDYIKNTEYDFFIQMDKKENILDCSNSLLKLTKLSKKEVLNMKGWKFIFDSFDIKTPNLKNAIVNIKNISFKWKLNYKILIILMKSVSLNMMQLFNLFFVVKCWWQEISFSIKIK